MSDPIILGIDPGIAGTGIAVLRLGRKIEVVELASVRTLPTPRKARLRQADDDATRLRVIIAAIADTIDRHKPILIAYETPVGSKGVRAAKSLAYVIGSVVTMAFQRDIAAMSVLPAEAKVVAAGSKTASKAEVGEALIGRFALDDLIPVAKVDREHALDALAVALVARESELVVALVRYAAQSARGLLHVVEGGEP